jgi:hypothetical protein
LLGKHHNMSPLSISTGNGTVNESTHRLWGTNPENVFIWDNEPIKTTHLQSRLLFHRSDEQRASGAGGVQLQGRPAAKWCSAAALGVGLWMDQTRSSDKPSISRGQRPETRATLVNRTHKTRV